MVAIVLHKLFAFVWSSKQHIWIMLLDKPTTLFRTLANDNALGLFKHSAKQGANTCRTSTNYQDGIFCRYLANACSPKACSKYIANKQRLLVCHIIWYAIQSLRSQRHTHILRLSAINTAT